MNRSRISRQNPNRHPLKMCKVSYPVESAQPYEKANLSITPGTDSIIGWLRPLGVKFKGPVHSRLNERISLTRANNTIFFYSSLNVAGGKKYIKECIRRDVEVQKREN